MPRLTEENRDELIIRIDERMEHLLEKDVPAISRHLLDLNGQTRGNTVRSKCNQAIIGVILGGSATLAAIAKVMHLW